MTKKLFLRALFATVLIASCLGPLVQAAATPKSTSDKAASARALQHFVDHVATFEATFTQKQTGDDGEVLKTQSGKVWLQRATSDADTGRFRWLYEKPYKQLIVCDGKKIWVYDPDLKQVTVRPAEKVLGGSPAALLAQRVTLTKAFNIAHAGTVGGQHIVKLTPRDTQSDFKSIVLSLKDGVPTRMVFHDQLGDTTEVRFSHIETNHTIAAKRFAFQPPKGVTVVGPDSGDSGAGAGD